MMLLEIFQWASVLIIRPASVCARCSLAAVYLMAAAYTIEEVESHTQAPHSLERKFCFAITSFTCFSDITDSTPKLHYARVFFVSELAFNLSPDTLLEVQEP